MTLNCYSPFEFNYEDSVVVQRKCSPTIQESFRTTFYVYHLKIKIGHTLELQEDFVENFFNTFINNLKEYIFRAHDCSNDEVENMFVVTVDDWLIISKLVKELTDAGFVETNELIYIYCIMFWYMLVCDELFNIGSKDVIRLLLKNNIANYNETDVEFMNIKFVKLIWQTQPVNLTSIVHSMITDDCKRASILNETFY